jgi:hypothetical protein
MDRVFRRPDRWIRGPGRFTPLIPGTWEFIIGFPDFSGKNVEEIVERCFSHREKI